jgi:hypothetical protein
VRALREFSRQFAKLSAKELAGATVSSGFCSQ